MQKKKMKKGWFRKLSVLAHIENKQGMATLKPNDFSLEVGTRIRRVWAHLHKKGLKELSSLYAEQEFPAHEGAILTMKFPMASIWQVLVKMITKQRSELNKNLDKRSKELSMFVDGIERSPSQKMKARSKEAKELSVSVDRIQSSPIQIRKSKSESCKKDSESRNGIERNEIQLRKVKSESNKGWDESVDGTEGNSVHLRKVKLVLLNKSVGDFDIERGPVEVRNVELESNKVVDESIEDSNSTVKGIEKILDGIRKTISDETCKELDVCQAKVISSSLSNGGQVKSAPQLVPQTHNKLQSLVDLVM
ncbi:hypothetical protein F0562_032098 [Nyssa sinensis]|uniref:Uncharacterized protein n=1 Tax=Nyssa sinensis TaxID=561372 RepID=A0A5J5AUQ3_9ASTE|nr:hypothetical protein F0562_032098 [Nyssa sinensis]